MNDMKESATRTKSVRSTTSDIYIFVVALIDIAGWGVWMCLAPVWWLPIPLSIVSFCTLIAAVTRRAWRVALTPRSTPDLAVRWFAIRLAWRWRGYSRLLFDPVLDRVAGIYRLPGLKTLRFENGAILLDVLLPKVHIRRSVLSAPVEDGDFADVLGVDGVEFLGRDGDVAHYRITPYDATVDARHVAD